MNTTRIINVSIKYDQNQALSSIIGLMYCSGPSYYTAGKSLTKDEKLIIDLVGNRLDDERERIRLENPDSYNKFPYSQEEANRLTTISISTQELNLLITALKETIHESEDEDGYTLKVITQYDLNTAKEVLDILMKTKLQIV